MLELFFWLVIAAAAWWYVNNQYRPGQSEKKLLETKHRLDALLLLQKASVEEERERKVHVKERRTRRKHLITTRAKEFKAIEKILRPEDKSMLKILTREQKEQYCQEQGLNIKVLDEWVNLPPAELERRKMGLD